LNDVITLFACVTRSSFSHYRIGPVSVYPKYRGDTRMEVTEALSMVYEWSPG